MTPDALLPAAGRDELFTLSTLSRIREPRSTRARHSACDHGHVAARRPRLLALLTLALLAGGVSWWIFVTQTQDTSVPASPSAPLKPAKRPRLRNGDTTTSASPN